MNTITIPKKLVQQGDLIILSRKEYEGLLSLKKAIEFNPTPVHKKALARAENNLKRGRSLSYDELVRKLDFKN